MPPRRTRAAKAAQEEAKTDESSRGVRRTGKGREQEQEQEQARGQVEDARDAQRSDATAVESVEQAASNGSTGTSAKGKGKGKGKGKAAPEEEEGGADVIEEDGSSKSELAKALTMEERMEKMKQLRKKMAESSIANRKAVATEANKAKRSAKQEAAIARKMAKAEKVLDERDAKERGEDVERQRAMGYSIEENEAWEAKLAKKAITKDQGAIDPQSAAERTYRRQINQLKPDLTTYDKQRASVLGASPLQSGSGSSSSAMTHTATGPSTGQVVKKDDLYGGINNLAYGDHKPDDAALDRVTQHLNQESDFRSKRSRYRPDDADAEVNYINDKNKHFNKKIKRFYDSYTQEIRENFERGTAL